MKILPTLGVFIIACFIPLTSTVAHANEDQRKWSIGIGNSYICLEYSASPNFSIEGRGAFGSRISVYSLRFYRNFTHRDKITTFIGLARDSVNSDEEDIEGDGSVRMILLGFEHFISERLTFLLDIGPGYISLSSDGRLLKDFNESTI